MFEIKVSTEFSAAHSLRGYKGKCEALHGHNWKVEIEVSSKKLNKLGMVVDFKELKYKVNQITTQLDHKHLNALSFFKKVNPTSENIAKYIYDNLKSQVVSLKSITVWESENSCTTYYEE